MNFSEGLKRIYIVLTCLVIIGVGLTSMADLPTKRGAGNYFSDDVKDAFRDGMNRELNKELKTRDIDFQGRIGTELVEFFCKTPRVNYLELAAVCTAYREKINAVPWEQAKYIGIVIGGLLAIAVCAMLLWSLMAWVCRGFIKGKNP